MWTGLRIIARGAIIVNVRAGEGRKGAESVVSDVLRQLWGLIG